MIERAHAHGFALVGVNNTWMSGRSAHYVEMVAQAGLIGIHFVPLEDYRRALAAEIALIKAAPRQGGVDEIRIPGERAYRERARRAREGLRSTAGSTTR